MPDTSRSSKAANNKEFIRIKTTFLYDLLIAIAALALLCLILILVLAGNGKKLKKYKAAYGDVAQITQEADDSDTQTTTDSAATTLPGTSNNYNPAATTAPGATVAVTGTGTSDVSGTSYIVSTQSSVLNMRSEADPAASVVTQIPRMTTVVVTNESNGWGYTTYNGASGWVNMEFLSPASGTAVTTAPTADTAN